MIFDLEAINLFLCLICVFFGAWAGWHVANEGKQVDKEEIEQLKNELEEKKYAKT